MNTTDADTRTLVVERLMPHPPERYQPRLARAVSHARFASCGAHAVLLDDEARPTAAADVIGAAQPIGGTAKRSRANCRPMH